MVNAAMQPGFEDSGLLAWLEAASEVELNAAPFGIIGMGQDGTVRQYNQAEAALSGLTPSRVVGRHFFTSVAPCTNNYLVAHRFENECELDAVIDYVFTLRMAPTPVKLRLLRSASATGMYLVVERRAVNGT